MAEPAPPKGGWNWWAFFFGGLWYLAKGMWVRGLVFFALDLLAMEIIQASQATSPGLARVVRMLALTYHAVLGRTANAHFAAHRRKQQAALRDPVN